MQLILTPEQMRALEARAFSLGTPSLLLMENAARSAHSALKSILCGLAGKDILYLIGEGNNGGDGLAMARLCRMDGGRPRILLTGTPRTQDSLANLSYVKALGIPVSEWGPESNEGSLLPSPDAVIDAVYGTGYHGELPENIGRLTKVINSWGAALVAVDAPSGMDSLSGEIPGGSFTALYTVVLGHLKTGLCLTRHPDKTGELLCVPIGIPEKAYDIFSNDELISALEPGDLKERLPRRAVNAHKGDCGHILMYMGSMGMAGAAGMAAQAALACLRSGAGLVTIVCEPGLIPILQALVPNAMCLPVGQTLENPPAYDVFAVGCGLGVSEEIWKNIHALWRRDKPSIWDADALNLLAEHPMDLGEKTVITPHPGEAARLLNWSTEEIIRAPLDAAAALQQKYCCTVVLKGAVSVIRDEKHMALNLEGSPALAKGGSGDALTGVIASLLVPQLNNPPFEAARTACLWHGMAGQEAARQMGVLSPLTSDVINCLGCVSQ